MGSESLPDFSKVWVKADQTGSALGLIPPGHGVLTFSRHPQHTLPHEVSALSVHQVICIPLTLAKSSERQSPF